MLVAMKRTLLGGRLASCSFGGKRKRWSDCAFEALLDSGWDGFEAEVIREDNQQGSKFHHQTGPSSTTSSSASTINPESGEHSRKNFKMRPIRIYC